MLQHAFNIGSMLFKTILFFCLRLLGIYMYMYTGTASIYKVSFCNKGLWLHVFGSHYIQWCLLLTIKKGPDDFLWHSSKVDIWRWNMCVFLAWSIWFAWWTSTQCRSMPYFRQWYWRVGNVSFRSAALSTSNSALSKCFISIFFKS